MESIASYIDSLGGNDEVSNWIQTVGKKTLKLEKTTLDELEHIVDYLVSDSAPKRLRKMSFVDAKRKSEEWSTANKKKGRNLSDDDEDISTIHDFGDGSKIVKLETKSAMQREGYLMSHCVGGYSPEASEYDIYSYRDKNNQPHATFEVRKNNNEIVQIKGKGNGSIHPKYIDPIMAFLTSIGMELRKSDMKNLGYHYVPDCHKEFLDKLGVKLYMIKGHAYVHQR